MRFLNHHYAEKTNVIRSHLSVKAVTSIFPFIDLHYNLRWLDTQIHLSTLNRSINYFNDMLQRADCGTI